MPLGTRELLMVVRARDVASRVLREIGTNISDMGSKSNKSAAQIFGVGAALTGVGVTLAAIGVGGLKFFNDATDAAINYNKQAALTKTQVDQVGVSVKDIADIGRRVASQIPAPFDQMQAALYDIFSSMDVNVHQAESLLKGFSKSAVAGQVDIQTAGRASISIMNAYKLPISSLNHIMDVQFQLVRKGVGTYEEFNSSIGRAIPAAVSAGQSFETLAGMMAFLTRNGLSTEMAATSAARAMELFSKPDKFKALENLGIKVRDASGHFLQMNDIITQLANNEGWAKMTEPQRKEMFQKIFGTGTIQARRFFDLAIPNFQQLNSLTGDMANSTGSLNDAYKTMFDQPASKSQLLKNRYEVLKTEIGDQLIPAKLKLMEIISNLLDRWEKLDDGTKKIIVKIALFASIFATVTGVVLTVVGAFMMLVGIIAPLVGGVTAAIMIIGGIGLAIAAVIAIGYLLIKNWDTISKVAKRVWADVKQWAGDAWHIMQDFWDWITQHAVSVWHTISEAANKAFVTIHNALEILITAFQTAWSWLSDTFGPGLSKIWNELSKGVSGVAKEVVETFQTMTDRMSTVISIAWEIIEPVLTSLVSLLTGPVLDGLKILWQVFKFTWDLMVSYIQIAVGVIWQVIQFALDVIKAAWDNFHKYIFNRLKDVWDLLVEIVSNAIKIISNIIQLVLNIIQGDWGDAWKNIKNIFKAAWDAIWAALQFVWRQIAAFFMEFVPAVLRFLGNVAGALFNRGRDLLMGMWHGIQGVWATIADFFGGIPARVLRWFGGAIHWLWDAGHDILMGLWNGMKSVWDHTIGGWLSSLGGKIAKLKGPADVDAKLLTDNGELIMQGLLVGLQTGWQDVEDFLGKATMQMQTSLSPTITPSMDMGTLLLQQAAISGSQTGPKYGLYVENLNVKDTSVVSDLDFWMASNNTGV